MAGASDGRTAAAVAAPMVIKTRILAASLACVWALSADQVTLKNGDRITGDVVKKDAKTLTFKTEALGTLTIPWEKVQTLRTDKPVNVVFAGDRTEKTTIAEDTSLADVIALRDETEQQAYERLLSPAWTNLWAGTAALGYAGTKGNAETETLTIGMNAARITRTDKTTVQFNAIRASALVGALEGATARAIRAGWGYNRNLFGGLFINTFNDYEYDRFQALDLRIVLGGGLGYTPWKTDRGRLDVLGGGAWNRENFSSTATRPGFIRSAAELYFGNELSFKLNSVTSMFQNLRVFPNLTNTGEYRLNLDLGANTRLFRWLTWNVALSNRRLSNPVPGRQPNDLLYTTGLGVTFTR
jgi:hypothetical protein